MISDENLFGKTVVVAFSLEQVKQLQKQFADKLPQNEPLLVNEWLAAPSGERDLLLWHKADSTTENGNVDFKVDGWPKKIFFLPDNFFIIGEDGTFSDIRDMTSVKWGVGPTKLQQQ